MIVQPSPPVQPGKLLDPVVVGAGVAVVPGAGVGVTLVPGAGVAVANGVAVGTAVDAVGTGAAAVGVGVVEASLSGPLASATISSTTPISASSPSPAAQHDRHPPPARLRHLGLGRRAARQAPLLIGRERAPAARAAPLRRGRRERGVVRRRRDGAHRRRSKGL